MRDAEERRKKQARPYKQHKAKQHNTPNISKKEKKSVMYPSVHTNIIAECKVYDRKIDSHGSVLTDHRYHMDRPSCSQVQESGAVLTCTEARVEPCWVRGCR